VAVCAEGGARGFSGRQKLWWWVEREAQRGDS
jgi:hypothetical protein